VAEPGSDGLEAVQASVVKPAIIQNHVVVTRPMADQGKPATKAQFMADRVSIG